MQAFDDGHVPPPTLACSFSSSSACFFLAAICISNGESFGALESVDSFLAVLADEAGTWPPAEIVPPLILDLLVSTK